MSESFTRFRVKKHDQDWDDIGPDLLRNRTNARKKLASTIKPKHQGRVMYRRFWQGAWSKWSEPANKAQVLKGFDAWKGGDFTIFQVGIKQGAVINQLAEVRAEAVTKLIVPNVHDPVNIIWSLGKHQFKDVQMGGGFVCKLSAPGYTSNHAWKDAVDFTPPGGSYNDKLFDWLLRMVLSGNMDADQIIGSRDGRVVNADAPDWDIEYGGADSSHLWHVHVSYIDHNGANSPYCSNA